MGPTLLGLMCEEFCLTHLMLFFVQESLEQPTGPWQLHSSGLSVGQHLDYWPPFPQSLESEVAFACLWQACPWTVVSCPSSHWNRTRSTSGLVSTAARGVPCLLPCTIKQPKHMTASQPYLWRCGYQSQNRWGWLALVSGDMGTSSVTAHSRTLNWLHYWNSLYSFQIFPVQYWPQQLYSRFPRWRVPVLWFLLFLLTWSCLFCLLTFHANL